MLLITQPLIILQCIRNAGNNIILGLQIHIKENQILIDQLHVLLLIRFISDKEINHTDSNCCSCCKR